MTATTATLIPTNVDVQRESWGTPTGRVFRDYNVQVQVDGYPVTIGRISGSAGAWVGLPIGATTWTRWHRTKALALAALQRRENIYLPETHLLTTG